MPKDFTKQSSFAHFGTKQTNVYQSWSALSEDERTVAVTIWKDQLKYKGRGPFGTHLIFQKINQIIFGRIRLVIENELNI